MKLDEKAVIAKLKTDEPIWKTLDEEQINAIQSQCQALFEKDSESCEEWRNEAKELMEMARMKSKKRAHIQPWQADIQVADLIQSAIQFNARTYPEYVKDGRVCKPKIVGKVTDEKQSRATRVIDHMNWQLTEQITEWPENLDKQLIIMPIVGNAFKVNTYDEAMGRIVNTLCMPDQVTINNAPNNPDWSRRISIEYPVGRNHLVSKQASGEWRDNVTLECLDGTDDDPKYQIVDMHCWYDLDSDGYEEPYVLTLDKTSWKLLGIIPRYDAECLQFKYDPQRPAETRELIGITAIEYITHYCFIPAPDGSALGMGYGHVGKPMIEAMNTCLNQLMDAGTLQNLGGGFVKKGTFRDDGTMLFSVGEWKTLDGVTGAQKLSEAFFPVPTPTPSAVTQTIFSEQKQGFAAIAATSEIASGTDLPANTPATSVLAILDQAKMGARAILKRINIAMGRELKIIQRLNKAHLQDDLYFTVGDFEEKHVASEDYETADFDIVPVADPQYSSRIERLTKIQAAQQMGIQSPALVRDALIELGYSPEEADKYMASNQNQAVMEAQAQAQALAQQEKTAKAQKEALELQIKLMEQRRKNMETQSRVMVDKTVAIKNLADAEAVEVGMQVPAYAAQAEALEHDQEDVTHGDEAGFPAMGAEPGNEGSNGAATEGLGEAEQPGPIGAGFDFGEPAFPEGAGGGGESPDGLGQPEAGGV